MEKPQDLKVLIADMIGDHIIKEVLEHILIDN